MYNVRKCNCPFGHTNSYTLLTNYFLPDLALGFCMHPILLINYLLHHHKTIVSCLIHVLD